MFTVEYFPKRKNGEKVVEMGKLLLARRGVANAVKYCARDAIAREIAEHIKRKGTLRAIASRA
ncbi:hypothetical protein [Mucilaginibacter jinjuensis]|uniref:Transposase n=1 Tax=Mucilaginibacter jinjuensis TaxID=1176721 RepID=A0ABY7TE30_9SPHI|nr:hypothetical protein [Mucilaginibacter jinjuensis]WCT14716.1 hypothetical protein PQO05_12295 [Mucilaginibacter jinjuensis]